MIQFNLVPDREPDRGHVQIFVNTAFTEFSLGNNIIDTSIKNCTILRFKFFIYIDLFL